MSSVGNLIPLGFHIELERRARHGKNVGEGHKEGGGNGIVHFDGVASCEGSRKCVVEGEIVGTHHHDIGTARDFSTCFIEEPSCLGIRLVVIFLMKKYRQAERSGAKAKRRVGGEIGRHPVFASGRGTLQSTVLIGDKESVRVEHRNGARASV